ncbi:hypothetical protein CAOG_01640 [Capsaspora owczarzaki ATCC 30864]|uniref:Uncharacterized protein n=1 Tax=Capsaspora owczarzaki (strain ATCC 30864) TaxID=595528 RepID=A0A0D2WJM9_CAPO3|nr:hypothetical protein CAOG_01640 [Capsaspora owczarzaki ATCC 30864]KJE90310.1 hypothetical protein, variant [Capsaspora owczarzaki ATCC 30864]|eukprot:XP_004364508.1 hypothetical protein CAOG_01640 [Capsaspora owczarzaki ATCC 30864]
MLRHLLIISPAGTVLYDREFVKLIAQPRLTGSLITAILKVCSDVTGLPASYVEIGAVAVSIRTDAGRTGIICALFHDVQDGKQLGQLVATELLRLFLDRFRQHVSPPPVNLGIFQSFHSKILEGIRSSVRLVVDELQRCVPSIELCFLASNGRISHSTVDIDGVGVMANLSALREYAEELMAARGDTCNRIVLERVANRVVIHAIGPMLLVVVMPRIVPLLEVQGQITAAVSLIARVSELSQHMQGSTHTILSL